MLSVPAATSNCPLCKYDGFTILRRIENANLSPAIHTFNAIRCSRCQLVRMDPWPRKKDLETLYAVEHTFSTNRVFKPSGLNPNSFSERFYRRFGSDDKFIVKKCLNYIDIKREYSVLDIGCGNGRLLQTFKLHSSASLDLTGIDIDAGSLELVPNWLHDRILIGNFTEMDFDQKFDIITMKFVVEHLPNALAFVEHAVKFLSKGGILLISTPDIDSPKSEELQCDWPSLNDSSIKTGHILWFNRFSLKMLGEAVGLTLVKCTNRGELFYHLRPWQKRIMILLFGKDSHGRPIRNTRLRLFYAALFDGTFSQVFNYGDSLYAFYKHSA